MKQCVRSLLLLAFGTPAALAAQGGQVSMPMLLLPASARALAPQAVADAAARLGLESKAIATLDRSIEHALSVCDPADLICVAGSLYAAGEARCVLPPAVRP